MSRAAVITVSDRSAAGEREDASGPLAADLLRGLGLQVDPVIVVPDDYDAVRRAISAAVSSGASLVLTTGGTGLGPRDVTPEATRSLLQREAPGLAEMVRAAGLPTVPTAVLSRGMAGTVERTLVINLAGSPGAVRDGVRALGTVLAHALAQLGGADH